MGPNEGTDQIGAEVPRCPRVIGTGPVLRLYVLYKSVVINSYGLL